MSTFGFVMSGGYVCGFGKAKRGGGLWTLFNVMRTVWLCVEFVG